MDRQTDSNQRYWRANWQREIEGAYLYRQLARFARTPDMQKMMAEMAGQEKTHAAVWAEHIQSADPKARPPRPDLRVYLIAGLARWLGAEAVLGLLINDEVSDIATYADQANRLGDEATYRRVLSDETSHARALAALRSPEATETAEPWHRSASAGGLLRVVVYGFNDGLTANFGLVMGVIGASVSDQTILLAGFAGLLADAFSMASSGFLAARSEQEVRQYHLALERAELRLMPQEERQELKQYFMRKGLTSQEAATVADRLMENPDVALTQLAREELGIDPEAPQSPLQEGIVTGIATGLGAVIPIIPFFFLPRVIAIWVGVIISMVAHFLVGASRAIFTGRPAIRSGFEMFLVGMGVALFTYLLGQLLGVRL
jgi:VIT1/CCC1 family predicted Fe2+/Mn2+ transporter